MSAYDLAVHWFELAATVAVAAVWLLVAALQRRGLGGNGPARPRMAAEGRSPVLLAMLLSAGALHAAPVFDRLPVDLGILLLVLVALASAHQLGGVLSAGGSLELWPLGLMLVVAVLGYFRAADTAYAHNKVVQLGVTCVAVACATVLLRSSERRVRFLQGIVAVGVVALVLSVASPSSTVAAGRVAAEGATTIATGRMAGSAVVVLVAWIAAGRLRPVVWGPVVIALGALMFETGSRGPLVAAAVAFAVLFLLAGAKRPLRTTVLTVAVLAAADFAWSQASGVSQSRISTLTSSDKGASVTQRQFMWSRSWDLAQHSVWGRGWGSLQNFLIVDRYPHNLLLEVWAEAGWVAAAALLALVGGAVLRAYRARLVDPAAMPLLALVIFWAVNAAVSGDTTDNRGLFVVAAACWVSRPRRGQTTTPSPSDERRQSPMSSARTS